MLTSEKWRIEWGYLPVESGRAVQGRLWEEAARRWVIHVDMDAFFASVEQRDDPGLAGKPVIVANSPMSLERLGEIALEAAAGPPVEMIKGVRGVVASASYEARAFGVRSAMPLARALVLCPQALVLRGRFDRYHDVAEQLRRIWAEFSPVVEPMSLDEAYLDLAGSDLSGGSIRRIAERLKARIKSETGLTASVGVGSSKLMAKIASDLEKPDGLVVIEHGDEARTLAPMPVRVLPGVGPRTAEVLHSLGLTTLGQLAAAPYDTLCRAFSRDNAESLLRRAVGIDNSPVQVPGDPKSVSNETTLVEDTCDLAFLRDQLRELSDRVTWTLRREGFMAKCVYIKLRLLPAKRVRQQGFGKLITRQVSLPVPTDAAQEVFAAAARLLETAALSHGIVAGQQLVRLIGVGTASLCRTEDYAIGHFVSRKEVEANGATPQSPHAPNTQSAIRNTTDRARRVNAGVDAVRARFGYKSISIGSRDPSVGGSEQ